MTSGCQDVKNKVPFLADTQSLMNGPCQFQNCCIYHASVAPDFLTLCPVQFPLAFCGSVSLSSRLSSGISSSSEIIAHHLHTAGAQVCAPSLGPEPLRRPQTSHTAPGSSVCELSAPLLRMVNPVHLRRCRPLPRLPTWVLWAM